MILPLNYYVYVFYEYYLKIVNVSRHGYYITYIFRLSLTVQVRFQKNLRKCTNNFRILQY